MNLKHYAFLLATCKEPIHPGNWRNPNNQRVIGFLPYGARVNGTFPVGTEAYFECMLGYGSRIVHHPAVCQANGRWRYVEDNCEGSS